MNWVKVGKTVVTFVTSAGVSAVVSNAVKATTPSNLNTLNRILVGVGGFVLSAMVADQSTKYVEKQIDDLIELTKKE